MRGGDSENHGLKKGAATGERDARRERERGREGGIGREGEKERDEKEDGARQSEEKGDTMRMA